MEYMEVNGVLTLVCVNWAGPATALDPRESFGEAAEFATGDRRTEEDNGDLAAGDLLLDLLLAGLRTSE